jgi:hypothetical protein
MEKAMRKRICGFYVCLLIQLTYLLPATIIWGRADASINSSCLNNTAHLGSLTNIAKSNNTDKNLNSLLSENLMSHQSYTIQSFRFTTSHLHVFETEAGKNLDLYSREQKSKPVKERIVYYLKPSLKLGGLKRGSLSLLDDIMRMNTRARPYYSRGRARLIAITDSFLSSAFSAAVVGGIASIFSEEKGKTFMIWSLGYFPLEFAVESHKMLTSIHSIMEICYMGEWVNPSEKGLTKHGKTWLDQEDIAWEVAQSHNTIMAYQEYLDKYPDARHKKEAGVKIEEITWVNVKLENTVESYRAYLRSYPSGRYADKTMAKVLQFDRDTWKTADSLNTVSGYDRYIGQFPDGVYSQDAAERIDQILWERTKVLKTLAAYQEYIRHVAGGKYELEAKQKIAEFDNADWKKAKTLDAVDAYRQYLDKHKDGKFRSEARDRIYQIESKIIGTITVIGFKYSFSTSSGKEQVIVTVSLKEYGSRAFKLDPRSALSHGFIKEVLPQTGLYQVDQERFIGWEIELNCGLSNVGCWIVSLKKPESK